MGRCGLTVPIRPALPGTDVQYCSSINNKLGSRLTLQLGTFGYSLYIGSFLSVYSATFFITINAKNRRSALNIHQNSNAKGFVIAAGTILGVCAALLWTAQGSLMMSYPTEAQKGKFIGIFWAIFQFGSFIGSVIALAINIRSGGLSAVATSTYIVRLAPFSLDLILFIAFLHVS